MMMIPVQVIAFFIAVMVIPADVREFTIELQGKKIPCLSGCLTNFPCSRGKSREIASMKCSRVTFVNQPDRHGKSD